MEVCETFTLYKEHQLSGDATIVLSELIKVKCLKAKMEEKRNFVMLGQTAKHFIFEKKSIQTVVKIGKKKNQMLDFNRKDQNGRI